MKQSLLFTKTKKDAPKDEVAKNAQLLIRAGYIHKDMAGVYSYLPLGLKVISKIADIIRDEMNGLMGAQEVLLSALHPIENYESTGRSSIDVLFHTELAAGGHLVMGQSHEEIIVPLLKQYVTSYRDLPLGVYQIQTKFRNELRAKSGIMRGREFMMKDLYSFHLSLEDFEDYYEKSKIAYKNIFEKVGIGEKTYLTYATGGTFSKYSHEFQTVTDVGEDTIYICNTCRIAINDELIGEQTTCPSCDTSTEKLSVKKSIEVGNIFPLQTKFSDAFKLTVKTETGEDIAPIMGCYGIGLGRLMGTVVELYADDKGIVWPVSVAPFKVHLVSLCKESADIEKADALYASLQSAGIEVLYDDRDVRAGEKFADSDLMGMPLRLVVSARSLENNQVESKVRVDGTETMVSLDDVLTHVASYV